MRRRLHLLQGAGAPPRSGTALHQGDRNLLDVLASSAPSFNVSREAISDAATMVRPFSLRGLPSDSTLVLVNGKRQHRGAVIGEFVAGVQRGAQGVEVDAKDRRGIFQRVPS